jgi:hypothetical protein
MMNDADILQAWNDYSMWCAVRAKRVRQYCERCDGFGDHGVEEETGCLYTCYACAGTGFEPTE